MAGTDPTTLRRTETGTDQGESDEYAHIVMRDDQLRGYVAGEAIQALCGKVFVPSRDYERLPVCQKCVEERDRLLAGMKRFN
ncbi:MAG: DUF3039 domain-containing protein [Acidimicrobiia bacterium]